MKACQDGNAPSTWNMEEASTERVRKTVMDAVRALVGGITGGKPPAAAYQAQVAQTARPVAQVREAAPVDLQKFIAAEPVANLGTYLNKTQSDNIPRWEVLTALRAYGLNVNAEDQTPAIPQAETPQTAPVTPQTPATAQATVTTITAEAPPAAVQALQAKVSTPKPATPTAVDAVV